MFRSSYVSTASFAMPYFLHLPSARQWLYVFCIPSHHHSTVRLTTGPEPLPKRFLYRMRYNSPFFNFQCPPVYLRSSSTCLVLLPRLPVTYVFSSIFPLKTSLRRSVRTLDMTNPVNILYFLFYAECFSSSLLYVILLHFTPCERQGNVFHTIIP